MKRIYKIVLDTSRKGDPEYDAVLYRSDDSEKISYYFSNPNIYDENLLPKEIYFDANFNYIPEYDFPFLDVNIFIVSKKVLSIFNQYIEFKFTIIPVIMMDDTFLESRFKKDGSFNERVPVNNDYVALRFPFLESYFDYDNSDYGRPRYDPNGVSRIKRLVLKEPPNGFPSIFKTKEKSSIIFINNTLKQTLEENKIKGCVFEEVEVSSNTI